MVEHVLRNLYTPMYVFGPSRFFAHRIVAVLRKLAQCHLKYATFESKHNVKVIWSKHVGRCRKGKDLVLHREYIPTH